MFLEPFFVSTTTLTGRMIHSISNYFFKHNRKLSQGDELLLPSKPVEKFQPLESKNAIRLQIRWVVRVSDLWGKTSILEGSLPASLVRPARGQSIPNLQGGCGN
jgi:hypothetical protein